MTMRVEEHIECRMRWYRRLAVDILDRFDIEYEHVEGGGLHVGSYQGLPPGSFAELGLAVAALGELAQVLQQIREASKLELPACAAVRHASGVVFAGKRHDECFKAAYALDSSKEYARQGFMTNRGRFVDRQMAFRMMQRAGIESAAEGGYRGAELYSEDLY